MNDDPASSAESEKELLEEFAQLWEEADQLWEKHDADPAFGGYVSSDYEAAYEILSQLKGQVTTVLEWGSGLGIVAIMASRMGFEAYGIEAEPKLVEFSEEFADKYGPDACFAQGSFIPEEFDGDPAAGEHIDRTMLDFTSGYEELDMELRDFDLIYAYPWPEEHAFFRGIVREFGHANAMLAIYDAREGLELTRFGKS